jgi:Flp pilus assembly protein TadD
VRSRINGLNAAVSVLCALGLTTLCACEQSAIRLDPLTVDGRDGGGQPLSYDTLMRIGAASHASGDLGTAVGLYRRAAAVAPSSPAPFVAAGNTLMEMGKTDEAIIAYHSAMDRTPGDPEALRGLGRAYLLTGKPELAGEPLGIAYKESPDDPKLLEIIGVADDFAGQHEEAQARYRRGLELRPRDPGLSLDLALSLAITGNYAEAEAILGPIAMAVNASPRERQTLALIYGLQGNVPQAERFAALDLSPQAVQRNLAYYDTLRRLTPEARARAIQSIVTRPSSGPSTVNPPA